MDAEPKWFHPGIWWIKRIFIFLGYILKDTGNFIKLMFFWVSGDPHPEGIISKHLEPTTNEEVKSEYDRLIDLYKEFWEVLTKGLHTGFCVNSPGTEIARIAYHMVKRYKEGSKGLIPGSYLNNLPPTKEEEDRALQRWENDLDDMIWALKVVNEESDLSPKEMERRDRGLKAFALNLGSLWT